MSLSSSSVQLDQSYVSRMQRLDQAQRRNKIGFALSTILMIGGVWLTLAVYRVFPKSPNLLSNLGKYGKVICFGTLGVGAFLSAALKGHAEGVRALLDAGADPHAGDEEGTTSLMRAALEGDAEIVRALLDAGVDPNAVDKDGVTSLTWAALEGHAEVVRALLDAGADPNAVDKYGVFSLTRAAAKGHAEVVRALLDAGSDPNAVDKYGTTSLLRAAVKGHAEVVRALVEGGADPHHFPTAGFMAIQLVKKSTDETSLEILTLLLSAKELFEAKKQRDVAELFATLVPGMGISMLHREPKPL